MKKLWLILHSFLLSLSVIAWIVGADNLFGICVTTIIVLSFPLNLLIGWLFFAFESLSAFPGLMLLMAFVMSAVSYFQWIEIVPRIAKVFSKNFSTRDLQIDVSIRRENPPQIEEGTHPDAREWSTAAYDKENYSPVERVFTE